jgi:hypothetical protein
MRLAHAALWCLLALAAPAGATTLRSLDVAELAARAARVFEGRAVGSETRVGRNGGLRTCVAFQVLEVVKGPPVASPYELCFAGGARGGRALRVEGLRIPAPGEHGIYFVADPAVDRVNPLLGWDQGRFLVSDGPAPIVSTADGAPVGGLAADAPPARGPGGGVARGARLARPGEPALGPAAFKARVRELAAGKP